MRWRGRWQKRKRIQKGGSKRLQGVVTEYKRLLPADMRWIDEQGRTEGLVKGGDKRRKFKGDGEE